MSLELFGHWLLYYSVDKYEQNRSGKTGLHVGQKQI